MTKKTDKKILDLKEVGFKNLDGKTVKVKFDKKGKEEFCDILYRWADTLAMDELARELRKSGKAEITEQTKEELISIISKFYKRRIVEAFKTSI